MRLDELIQGIEATTVHFGPDGVPDIRRVVSDSRRVRPGDAFCAIAGHEADGHKFIKQAVDAGAVAVIVQKSFAGRPPADEQIARVVVADTRKVLGHLAHRCLGDPSRQMTVIGVTGTKGKTTTTYLVESILAAAGRACGVLGTIEYRLGPGAQPVDIPAHVTTPGADELAEMFASMLANNVRHVAMEVSSHALDQDRVAGIDFDVAIFTNLSGDHRDYHPTEQHYLDAKSKLFTGLRPDAAAILNRDASHSEIIAASTRAELTWFGLSSAADVAAQIMAIRTTGSRIRLNLPGEAGVEFDLPLIGRHNVSNALAAAAAGYRLGLTQEQIVAGLVGAPPVPGRLEPVAALSERQPDFSTLVDYAHTDDALDNVLSALRPMCQQRLIVVFGCGGDRDRSKRPRMAAVAEQWADLIIVTSDNPRTEDAEKIIDEIMAGFSPGGLAKVLRQCDRRQAIAQAVELARRGDVLLIAGKGHESYQVIGRERFHFDDRQVAAEMLAKRAV